MKPRPENQVAARLAKADKQEADRKAARDAQPVDPAKPPADQKGAR